MAPPRRCPHHRTFTRVGLKTDPRAVRLVDANQDGLMDIAVFTPLDAMRLYVQDRKGNFTDAAANPAFHKEATGRQPRIRRTRAERRLRSGARAGCW